MNLERLAEAIDHFDDAWPPDTTEALSVRSATELQIVLDAAEAYGSLATKIREWSHAYPLEVFPEPDHAATGHDPTLCSASMGRHVIGRLMKIIDTEETR